MTAWDSFHDAVLVNPGLQRELLATPDRPAFVAKVVERARAGGWSITADDVEEALRARRRAWQERWI